LIIEKTFEINILDEIYKAPDGSISVLDEVSCNLMDGQICLVLNDYIKQIDLIEVMDIELNPDIYGEGQREEAIEDLGITLEKLKLAVNACQEKIKEFSKLSFEKQGG